MAVAAVLVVAACDNTGRVVLGPGVTAAHAPRQEAIDAHSVPAGDFSLTVRAAFSVTAKLLSKRRYRWDEMAPAASWDFALAWGALSDEALLAGTRLVQGNRRMFWHLYDVPLPLALVEGSSANVHLVPATPAVERALAAVPEGAIVTLEGELVDLHLPDGRVVPTSLTRFDRGAGACEILRVNRVSVAGQQVDRATNPAGAGGRQSNESIVF